MRPEPTKPEVIIIAGANGSGKTTFAKEFLLENKLPFLNADEIAKEINSENVNSVQLQAGRQYFERLAVLMSSSKSFIFESTLSGHGSKKIIIDLKEKGYQIQIVYLFLHDPEICKARVRERVVNGGHHVPDIDIERRYWRSKINFWTKYRFLVDSWSIYTNSNDSFEEVAFGENESFSVVNTDKHQEFLRGIV